MTLHSRYEPIRRVGIFWFCGEGRKRSTFVGVSRAWAGTAVIAGARRLAINHEDGWSHVRSLNPALASFEFDHFPRGRLEWQEHTDQWRLYVDQKLSRGLFVTTVLMNWRPPRAQLVVSIDRQYRSRANIGLPALP